MILLGGPAVLRSHQGVRYRPVPLGVGVGRVLAGIERREGTIMAHIVRNQDSIGFCCVINTLTAGHVMKHPEDALPVPGSEPPTVQPGPSQTASAPWGFFIKGFVQTRCDPNCTSPSAPLNTSAGNPDVAVIAHVSPDPLVHNDPLGHTSPPNSDEPIRRMQYTATSYVNGPSGVIQIASIGTSLKMWGVMSDAPKGPLIAMNVTQFFTDNDPVHGNRQFKWSGLDVADLERNAIQGDSGALIAGNGVSNRHVYGIFIGSAIADPSVVYYHRAGDIKLALQNAGFKFHHFWGTQSGSPNLWEPATTQCDGSC